MTPRSIVRFCESTLKGILLLSAFLPLFVFDPLLFPFVFPRTMLFRVLILAGLLLYALLAALEPKYRQCWSPLTLSFAALVLVFALTALTGVNWYRSVWSTVERSEGLLMWLYLGAYLIVLRGMLRTSEDWQEFLRTVLIAGWLQTLYTFGQFFNLSFALVSTGERLSGSIGNPSFLAAYFILIIGCAGWLLTKSPGSKARASYIALIALNAFLLWHTQTRGAIIGFAAGLTLIGCLMLWRSMRAKALIIIITLLAVCTLGIGWLVARQDASFVRNNMTLNRLATISLTDITAQNRIIVWGAGLRGFAERPMLGWGLENFRDPFNDYFNPAITRDIGSSPWYDRAHNTVVEVAVASGLLGLLAFGLLWAWIGIALFKLYKRSPWEGMLLGGTTLAYFIQNLFVFDTINSYLLFFALLALIEFRTMHTVAQKKKSIQLKQISLIAGGVALVIIALLPLYYTVVRPTLANYYAVQAIVHDKEHPEQALIDFKKALSKTVPAAEEYRFTLVQFARDQLNLRGVTPETEALVRLAVSEMKKTIDLVPSSIQGYLLLAEVYLAGHTIDPSYLSLAEETARAVQERAPQRYQPYTTLGRIYMSAGKPEQGIEEFKKAIALNENFAETYWNLGIAYILNHEADKARESLAQALAYGYNIYEEKNIEKLIAAYGDSRDLKAMVDFLGELAAKFPDTPKYQTAYTELKALYEKALLETTRP